MHTHALIIVPNRHQIYQLNTQRCMPIIWLLLLLLEYGACALAVCIVFVRFTMRLSVWINLLSYTYMQLYSIVMYYNKQIYPSPERSSLYTYHMNAIVILADKWFKINSFSHTSLTVQIWTKLITSYSSRGKKRDKKIEENLMKDELHRYNECWGLLFSLTLHNHKNQTWKEQKVHKFQLLLHIKSYCICIYFNKIFSQAFISFLLLSFKILLLFSIA